MDALDQSFEESRQSVHSSDGHNQSLVITDSNQNGDCRLSCGLVQPWLWSWLRSWLWSSEALGLYGVRMLPRKIQILRGNRQRLLPGSLFVVRLDVYRRVPDVGVHRLRQLFRLLILQLLQRRAVRLMRSRGLLRVVALVVREMLVIRRLVQETVVVVQVLFNFVVLGIEVCIPETDPTIPVSTYLNFVLGIPVDLYEI